MFRSISEQKSIVFIPFPNQVLLEKGRGKLVSSSKESLFFFFFPHGILKNVCLMKVKPG